jgi:hypothetical protein
MQELPIEARCAVYDAIAAYSMNFTEPELTGLSKAIFTLIKPQLDANNKRYMNGCKGAEHGDKGGRPPMETPKETAKKTPKKPQENPKPTPNDNDNVNDNVNHKDKLITWIDTHAARVNKMKEPLTNDEAAKLRSEFDKDYLKEQFEAMHNYEPLIKKNVSTYKTFRSWARRNGHYKTWLKNKPTVETDDERDARIFMETMKEYNIHKTLHGEESANAKYFENGNLILNHVRPNNNNKRLA